VVNPQEAISGEINTAVKHQVITGFGGAEYFYNNFLTANPYSDEIYQSLFDPIQGLGVNLLRLGNVYAAGGPANFDPTSQTIVQNAATYYGSAPTILMSAWSPPAYLKSNNNTTGGTLRKVNGAYDYAGYAQWWHDSITAYRGLGINPSYVSIQNESDAVVGYISNSFNPSEESYNGTQYAGYNKALAAVHSSFAKLSETPTLIGPETQGIGYNTFQDYVNALNPRDLGVIAEHLYTGGDPSQPDTFNANMLAIDDQFPKKPKFDTEYYASSAFDYAWIMHNALVSEEVSAYLYWALAWPDTQSGLIYLDNPYTPSTWVYPHGWAPNDQYYAFKHFSYFIHPGYKRVDALVNDPDIRFSAYAANNNKAGAAVAINTSATRTITLSVAATGLKITNSHVYRSTFSNNSTERWHDLGALQAGNTVSLPPQSVATISINQEQ
jgi:O-glycosyl hydrolase